MVNRPFLIVKERNNCHRQRKRAAMSAFMLSTGAAAVVDTEEPCVPIRSRGRRAGRREQQRRLSRHGTASEGANAKEVTQPIIRQAAGDAPSLPLSVTLTPVGRNVETAPIQSSGESRMTDIVHHPNRTAYQIPVGREFEEFELIGTVYDAARLYVVGQITVYGRPDTGRVTMGNRHMNGVFTNVTYLRPWDSIDSIPAENVYNAHAFANVMDVHRRVPGGTFWFDRGSTTWETEMDLSRQPGAIVYPGSRRVRVVFERPRN